MKFYSSTKKNGILTFAGIWVELENIILSEFSPAYKPKIACSPSYADNRHRMNAVMLLDTKDRLCTGGIGRGMEIINLNLVDVLTV
jgi:hypothetical protein